MAEAVRERPKQKRKKKTKTNQTFKDEGKCHLIFFLILYEQCYL